MNTFILKIYRGSPGNQYWEEFELPFYPRSNVISSLMEIQKRPINKKGEHVTPVAWEQGCLEEVCGSCSMLINGRPRQACTALIAKIIHPKDNSVSLAPLTKFPLVRDLIVDRTSMFENLKKVHAWIDADSTYDHGAGPLVSPKVQEVMYAFSKCMTCGCCTESCPQVPEYQEGQGVVFMGPAPIGQAYLFNMHPTGHMKQESRNRPLMQEGGLINCGNAQNCVKVCPRDVPLTDAIAAMGLTITKQAFRDLLKPDSGEA